MLPRLPLHQSATGDEGINDSILDDDFAVFMDECDAFAVPDLIILQL